jgi:hypothetical protein
MITTFEARLKIPLAVLSVSCALAPLSSAVSAPRRSGAAYPTARSQTLETAYGQRDMWQVIDQVSTSELGGARNTSRYRTQTGAACATHCSATRTRRLILHR